MKKVLLLGDSIRIGYGKLVSDLLSDVAEVVQPAENCKWTKYLYWNFAIWAGETKYDLIHWNSGIWDMHYIDNNECFCSLEEYVRDNERLLQLIRKYSQKLVWATTIPGGKILNQRKAHNVLINTNREFPIRMLTTDQDTWNCGVQKYNQAAREYYKKNGVKIDDLFSVMQEHLEDYLSEDGIHPNDKGYEALAQHAADTIRRELSF